MPKDRTNQAKGNGRHDNQGLCVGSEGNGQQGVNNDQGQWVSRGNASYGFLLLTPLPLPGKGQSRILCQQRWQIFLIKCPNDLCRVGLCDIHICQNIDSPATIHPFNRRKPRSPLQCSNLLQRHFTTIGGADHHGFQCGYPGSIDLWKSHHDTHVVPAALYALHLLTVKGLSDLTSELCLTQSQHFSPGLNFQLDFTFASLEGVTNVFYTGIAREYFL